MIILSQNKTVLFPFNEAVFSNCSSVYGGNDSFLLGSYKSEKRAKEVLYKITEAYYHCNKVYKMPEE